jgi:tetratricopeptide (TPR) repeat protein
LALAAPSFLRAQQTRPKSQSLARQAASASGSNPSSSDDLLQRLAEQQAAIHGGDAASIEGASRRVTSAALRQLAVLQASTGNYTQAIELYRESLDREDSNDVRLELALTYLNANRPDNCIEEAEKIVITEPANARAWAIKGKGYMARGDYRNAAPSLSKSLALKRDVNVQYALAVAYLQSKDETKAKDIFRQMLRDYGDRGIWHEIFGGAYRDAKHLDDAIREFQLAVKIDPSLEHIHAFLGETMLEKNYWAPSPEILREFSEEVKTDPKGYFGHFYMGVLLSQQGDLNEANPHLKTAIEADPNNPDPWLYLGLNYFKAQDNANAKPALLKAVELTGDDQARANYQIRRAYIALGRMFTTQGDKQAAEPYLKKARELSDKSLAASSSAIAAEMAEGGMGSPPAVIAAPAVPGAGMSQGADDLGASGKPKLSPEQAKAIEQREPALRKVLGTSFNDWGTSEARQKNYARALTLFHEAEKWDPSTPELMRNVGLAAFRLGDYGEATRALQIAVKQNPHDQAALGMLGMSAFSSRQFGEAVKAFGAFGQPPYRDPRMTYAYAFSLAQTGEANQSVEVLKQLLQQPLPSEMLMGVGDLFNLTLDYDDALKTYQKVIEQDPSQPRAHYYAGDMLIKLGRPDEAIAQFEQELRITPDDPNVQYHYAYALLQTSRKDEALALLTTITTAHPDHAQAQYQLGKTLLEAGQYQQAIEHLEAAAKYDPDHDYVHYQLQAAYRKAGRTADADRELAIYKQIKNQKRETSTPQPKP